MDINQIAANIIAYAGDAQSLAMECVGLAREFKFNEMVEKLEKAKESALKAHRYHTDLIALGARDENLKINLLVVHASNHLSVAETLITMAELFVELKEEIKKC